MKTRVFFKKTKFTLVKSIYFHCKMLAKQVLIFVGTRLGKSLIRQKSSSTWESDSKMTNQSQDITETRVGSRTAAISKMKDFEIIVNGWKPLTIITKSSILDVVAVLDPPLETLTMTITPTEKHIRKKGPEIWGFWWDPRPETWDPSNRWSPGSGTLQVWPKIQDPYCTWDAGPETRNLQSGIRDPGPLSCRWNLRETLNNLILWNLGPKNYGSNYPWSNVLEIGSE